MIKDDSFGHKKGKHLSVFLGTFSPDIGPATELAFDYPFFGDFSADILLGNKKKGVFCVVEFEDGRPDSIFKKTRNRANPEWSSCFEHGFSQIVDWFYNLDDFKGAKGFAKTFGTAHIKFIGMLIIGRSNSLDDIQRSRLNWRTEKVLIDSHPIHCITYNDLYDILRTLFIFYRSDSKLEN